MITKKQLEAMSAHDIIKQIDFQEHMFWKMKMGLTCIETKEHEYCLSRKDELVDEMNMIKKKEKYDYLLLCIVNSLDQTNKTIVPGETEEDLIHKAFNMTTDRGVTDLGYRITHIRDLIPMIEASL